MMASLSFKISQEKIGESMNDITYIKITFTFK